MKKLIFSTALMMFVPWISIVHAAPADFPQEDKIIATLKANPYLAITHWETLQIDSSISPSAKTFINMIFVVENASSWSNSEVFLNELRKAQSIFRVCHVVLRQVLKVSTDISAKTDAALNNDDPYDGPPELALAQKGFPVGDPIGFLLKKRGSGTAVAYNQASIENEAQTGGVSWLSLQNTLWMTDNYIPASVTPNALPSFSMLAHEITHLIGNLGHLQAGPANLMQVSGVPQSISGDLNQDQCDAIQKYSAH